MRVTTWTTEAGEFVVLRLHKTNVLLPCEASAVELDVQNKATKHEQASGSLGLLSDCCHVVLLSSPLELLCLPCVLRCFPYQEDVPDIYCTSDCLKVAEQLHAGILKDTNGDYENGDHGRQWTLDQVLEVVRVVSYGEVLHINDVALQASAYPSGTGIGCAVWVISSPSCRLGYLPSASLHHPCAAVLDPAVLQNLDVMLLGPSCMAAAAQLPSSMHKLLNEACALVLSTMTSGGNVLLPLHMTGVLLPLLEQFLLTLEGSGAAASFSPIFYVSPAAARALLIGISASDSLSITRQQHVLSGLHPFPFQAAIQAGRLVVADSLADASVQSAWRTPACVFVSASSIHRGSGGQLLRKWAYEDQSQVLLTEAQDLPLLQSAIKSQLPPDFRIKVNTLVGSAGLSYVELAHLLDSVRPQQLVAPQQTLEAFSALPPHSRGVMASTAVHPYHSHQTLKVPTEKLAQSAMVTAQMTADVQLHELTSQLASARVSCTLQFKDNEWQVILPPRHKSPKKVAGPLTQPCLWGKVALQQLLHLLEEHGAEVDMRFEQTADGSLTVVHVLNWDSTVRLMPNSTVIQSQSVYRREQLGKLVTSALQHL